jgi:hypothetical protein
MCGAVPSTVRSVSLYSTCSRGNVTVYGRTVKSTVRNEHNAPYRKYIACFCPPHLRPSPPPSPSPRNTRIRMIQITDYYDDCYDDDDDDDEGNGNASANANGNDNDNDNDSYRGDQ